MTHLQNEYPEVTKVDVVGDVHGCFDELLELLGVLGYEPDSEGLWRHPEGRLLAFVGDITDRGPKSREALEFVRKHVEEDLAFVSRGNHDDKLGRALKGNPIKIAHGLESTLEELKDWEEDEKKQDYSKWLLDLPLSITFDAGKLLVCHAAPPPKDAGRGRIKSAALYGHTTGGRDANGFPVRLDWVPSYNEKATEDTPFVVWGHVTHEEPYVTPKAVCVDTCCFGGNKLTALRYPERELVSVLSRQEREDGRNLAIGGSGKTPKLRTTKPKPITDMSLPYLLEKLQEKEEDVLYLVDTDELLNKRQCGPLIIANASKALFEPEAEHQLYSKGIVYTKDPYRLVSLPLVKMHNHGCREFSDEVSRRFEDVRGVDIVFVEKMDGTMIQVFEHEGNVVFTTRSVMEGNEEYIDDSSFPYMEAAREIAKEKYPHIIDPSFVKGKTLVFELIHPEARVVTDYGDLQSLTLLSVFDLEEYDYWSSSRVSEFADEHDLDTSEIFLKTDKLDQGVAEVRNALDGREDLPEGAIVCFEQDGKVIHRVKVKTMEYLKYHRLKFQCTYKSVVEMIWNRPEMQDWDTFNAQLKKNLLTEEEVESFYREHFDRFMMYMKGVKEIRDNATAIVEDFNDRYDKGDLQTGEYYKTLAMWSREKFDQTLFGFIMAYARNGELPLDDVMWSHEPCTGFKAIVTRWKDGEEKISLDSLSFEVDLELN